MDHFALFKVVHASHEILELSYSPADGRVGLAGLICLDCHEEEHATPAPGPAEG